MSILTTCSLLPIRSTDCKKYSSIAFDGCFFYLTSSQGCFIHKFDCCFEKVECIETCRSYDCICYDQQEQCFWASLVEDTSKIVKLDRCFCEIGCISLSGFPDHCTRIMSIAYDCKRDTLVLAFPKNIVEITKEGCCIRLIETPHRTYTRSVLVVPPYFIAAYKERHHQYIGIYDWDGQEIGRCRFPRKYVINGLAFTSCWENGRRQLYLYVLTAKHYRYPYVIKLLLDPCYEEIECCECSSPLPERDIEAEFLPRETE